MKQHGVSIVLCHNCGHDHGASNGEPTHLCLELHGTQDDPQVCDCHSYQPVLKPFAGVTPKPAREGNNPWLVALAFVLLLALAAYAQWGIK